LGDLDVELSRKRETGFTLIELLVSIGIIGILSATSIQAFHEYRTVVEHGLIDAMVPTVKTAIEAGYTEQDASIPRIGSKRSMQVWSRSLALTRSSPDLLIPMMCT
jgi:prepilin-type N-terminal cleavage/methylation domain-containing protein